MTITVRDAILFYSTFLALFFEFFGMLPVRHLARELHPRDAFCVSVPNLIHTISELAEISLHAARALVDVSTFSGTAKQNLWGRPLVFAGEQERFVFLPALKSNLLRTINRLIDEHAGDNGRKGIFFQEHCREQLQIAASNGPLAKITWVAPQPIQTSTGDIDICILVGDVLIAAEVKYMGIPSDAYEYWRADRKLEDGVAQLRRKLNFISESPGTFLRLLRERYGAPALTRLSDVIPLVISSDAYHAGFPLFEIAVADLPILTVFLDNQFVELLQITDEGVNECAVTIYQNAQEAICMLRTYLEEPEAIRRLCRQIAPRELRYQTGVWADDKQITVRLESVQVVPGEPARSL